MNDSTPADPASAAALALRLFARRYGALALAWLPAVAANFAASYAILAYASAQGIPLDQPTFHDALRILGVALPALALAFVVQLASWSLVARVALDEKKAP